MNAHNAREFELDVIEEREGDESGVRQKAMDSGDEIADPDDIDLDERSMFSDRVANAPIETRPR